MVKILLWFSVYLLSQKSKAQDSTVLQWWNPAQCDSQVIEGQGWGSQLRGSYQRLPESTRHFVNEEVWKLSHNAAGLVIRFTTHADQIVVRYKVEGALAMPHMPATGVSGIDLYGLDSNGNYLWCAGKSIFKDTIEYRFANLKPINIHPGTGIEYRLYLPLFNTITWLAIGTPLTSKCTPVPVRNIKPIVVYGTSIVQGACASRPGMAWTAIVSRKLNIPVVNLGFSGAGRLDKPVIELMNEINVQAYIFDCLPNLIGGKADFTEAEIYQRIISAVWEIRKKHPVAPILLTDHFGYTDAPINPLKRIQFERVNEVNNKAFQTLKHNDVQHIFLLTTAALQQDQDTMVDGIHPTDLGMMRYANAYYQLLHKIL